jgi:hypothetical protein
MVIQTILIGSYLYINSLRYKFCSIKELFNNKYCSHVDYRGNKTGQHLYQVSLQLTIVISVEQTEIHGEVYTRSDLERATLNGGQLILYLLSSISTTINV